MLKKAGHNTNAYPSSVTHGAAVRILATALTLVAAFSVPAFAGDAILTWDPSTDSSVVRYNVHYGTSSGAYSMVVPVGLVTTFTVTGLGPGTYYFAVTAENATGGRSAYSNEVSKTFADTAPPVISAVAASAITSTGATLTWTTDEPATSLAEYGTTTAYGASSAVDTALVTAHSRTLTGLSPSTTYHYRVMSVDATGNVAVSADYTFTTSAAADTTPPVITNIVSGSVTSAGATITWTTNEAATTQVDYGTTAAYGASTTLNTALVTAHSAALAELQASTTYHFRVRSADAAGNVAVSGDQTFTTTAAPDTTGPVISGVVASSTSATSTVITWTTNEPSTSVVDYGLGTGYGSSATDTTLMSAHSVSLTGLSASTTYHYRVRSADAAGNSASSGDFTFTTSALPDTTAPVLSNITAGSITSSGVSITWTTNEASTTQVEYGPTTAYGVSTPLNAALVTSHSAALSGLQASTTYNYRVRSADAAGNVAVSGNRTFTTAAAPDTTAPVILNLATTGLTPTSAIITWTTNEPSTSQVEYGPTAAYGQQSPANATLVTSHRETVSNLTAGATYHVRVLSADAAGNLSRSNDLTVVLPSTPDTTPPQDVQAFSARGESRRVTLTWTNPPDADFLGVQIRFRLDRYPTGPTDGQLLGDFSGQPGERGQAVHDGLIDGVTYYYAAASYDQAGNRQSTVFAAATPTSGTTMSDSSSQDVQTGGCGMIVPRGNGPSGPWQAADLLVMALVAMYLMRRRLWGWRQSGDAGRLTSSARAV